MSILIFDLVHTSVEEGILSEQGGAEGSARGLIQGEEPRGGGEDV